MAYSNLAQLHGSPNCYSGRYGYSVDHITMHIQVGDAQGTLATFDNPDSQASSNYVIGSDGSTYCCVDESNGSWADGSFESNCSAITIEHAGGLPQIPNTDECVNSSANLCADIARRMGWDSLYRNDDGTGNFRLHRDIPPYTHPDCPDICPNPLRWQEILAKANAILDGNTAGTIQQNGDIMVACVYGSDNFSGLKYWDGVHAPVGIQSQNHLSVLQEIFKNSTGRDLPLLSFNGAWGVVAEQAMVSASQQDGDLLKQRVADIENNVNKILQKQQ